MGGSIFLCDRRNFVDQQYTKTRRRYIIDCWGGGGAAVHHRLMGGGGGGGTSSVVGGGGGGGCLGGLKHWISIVYRQPRTVCFRRS